MATSLLGGLWEGKLSNPRARAARAARMEKIYETHVRAPRGALYPSYLLAKYTVVLYVVTHVYVFLAHVGSRKKEKHY